MKTNTITVQPKNYRQIALCAIEHARQPVVLLNGRPTTDFSESGPLTQRNILDVRDFEVRDGQNPMLGFHDHPDQMWVCTDYAALLAQCVEQGWLYLDED
ncbi:hypothetical protein [Hydrogenophaga sp. 5NK40-0174]|uniref:hypothetical protein n=1 Tax=Hydrogenophaga sp. 5NK40-0174 TaxID=3127649 RepID=UPI0031041FED